MQTKPSGNPETTAVDGAAPPRAGETGTQSVGTPPEPAPGPPASPVPNKQRVALYVVARTAEKRDAQLEELKAFALSQGVSIAKVYREKTNARPMLRCLLGNARASAFNVVLVKWIGLLGRTRMSALQNARKLDALGIRVVSMAEPWWDPRSPMAEWIAWAEQRRQEKSVKALEAKRERGEAVGTPPIGFRRLAAIDVTRARAATGSRRTAP